jgi:hypothetical protein
MRIKRKRLNHARRVLPAVAAVLLAASAHAGTYNFPGSYFASGDSGVQGYDDSLISGQPTGNSSTATGTVLTGADLLTSGPLSLQAYCADLSDEIVIGSNLSYDSFTDSSSTAVDWFGSLYSGANGTTIIKSLEYLASVALPQVDNADTSAALQIALWDEMYGAGVPGNPFSVEASGADQAVVNADVTKYLSAALNLAASGGPITEQLVLLKDDGSNGGPIQNLVYFTPVPLPPGLAALASGLLLLALAARRQRPWQICRI